MNYFRRYSVLDSICLGKEKGSQLITVTPGFPCGGEEET